MKSFLKKLYYQYINKKYFMLGMSHLNLMRPNYKNIVNLKDVEYKVFSQNGEDGILDYIIFQLCLNKPKFLEIGVGDYSESNTKFIFDRASSKGMIIDYIENFRKKVTQKTNVWKGQLEIINKQINSKNILETINSKNFFSDLDILSLDIDGIDYWILNEFPKNFSKIVVVEYNSIFGNEKKITVPNIDKFYRTDYHYSNLCFGMSLPAAIEIMQNKNFYFLGVNLMRNNAFFVSNNFPKEKYFKNLEIEKLDKIEEANFQESRDQEGNLNFLGGEKRIKEIFDCEVINLDQDLNTRIKIGEIYKINDNTN